MDFDVAPRNLLLHENMGAAFVASDRDDFGRQKIYIQLAVIGSAD